MGVKISNLPPATLPLTGAELVPMVQGGVTAKAQIFDFFSSGYTPGNFYAINFRPGGGTVIWTSGAGTPEGAVTAVVGSLYTRTDGGVNTTLYVKQTGTGNTGWAAK